MINKNFKLLMGANSYFHENSVKTPYVVDENGNTFTSMSSSALASALANGKRTIVFGSGTTQPTENDISMETPITNLTVLTTSNYPISNDWSSSFQSIRCIAETTIVVKNNTTNDIIVSELGIAGTFTSSKFILNREVISPVTIQPGETYTFTITIGG